MVFPLVPRITNRIVKVRADLDHQPGGGPYQCSTGFVVQPGVVLTSAHGVAGAKSIIVSDLQRHRYTVKVDAESVWCGHPEGPAVDKAPDIAVLKVPGLGPELPRFQIARLGRCNPSLTTLRDVHVVGFPEFTETTTRRNVFHDSGKISLLSNQESGLVDVTLSAAPRELDLREDLFSQWSGISGAPVIAGGMLVAVVTEHSRRMGPSSLAATPLGLLDAHPEWPDWGLGVRDADAWWVLLGVDDPSTLPVLPGEAARVAWIHDLRALSKELSDRTLESFAVQAHEALLDAFQGLTYANYSEALRRLLQTLATPAAARGISIYGLSISETLTSRALIAALDHLLVVHRVAARVPIPALHYRLAAPHIEVEDLDNEYERWVRQSQTPEGARDVIARLEVTTGKDAYGDLLGCLSNAEWNEENPVLSVRRLVEFVFSESFAVVDAAQQIEQCFLGGRPAAAHMLTGDDVERPLVDRDEHGFLVNEQPTLMHLRRGYFAPATELDVVEDAYWSWYQGEVVSGSDRGIGRVPTFWLTGPSGAGKSILLLQLLARLNTRASASVLWLGNAVEQLGKAAEQALSLSRDRHVVIGVDDPLILTYAGGDSAWRTALDALGRRRQTEAPSTLPIFVCCAPTEQYERFRRMHAGDVQLGRYTLNPYRPEFSRELRRWYEERTGRETQGPERDQTLLPAQLFFEWWKGEGMNAFARRFRDRITARDLPELNDFFYRLLSVNRLYVGYPSEAVQALPPEVRDDVDFFQRDMHLDRPTVTRPGYWLSHPHLANVIYEEWFPEGVNHDLRGAHLTAALLDAARLDRQGWASFPLVEQLLLALDPANVPAADSRTDPEHVRAALTTAASVLGRAATDLSSPVLAAWVTVEQRVQYGLGGWSPLAEALERLRGASETELGLAVLITALAELGDVTADQTVWTFLGTHHEWRAWTPTAALLLGRRLVPAHVETLAAGIRAQIDDGPALDLLGTALRHHPSETTLRSLAHDIVEGRLESTASLAPLVAVLFSLGGESERIALAWLSSAVRKENGLVLAAVLRRRWPPAIAWHDLAKWLMGHPLEDAADVGFARMVSWERLADGGFQGAFCKHLSQRDDLIAPELFEAIVRLLASDSRGWSFLFTMLTAAQARRPELRSAALSWLKRHGDSTAWHRVYVHVCRAADTPDEELVRLGQAHLPQAWDYSHCTHILGAMLRRSPEGDLPKVVGTTLSWLKTHPDENGWGFLARPVFEATALDDVETVATDVFRWWLDHQEGQGASYAVRALLAAPLPGVLRRDVVSHAETWLEEPRLGWAHVFLDLLPRLSDERAVAISLPWLMREFSHDLWAAVFAAVNDQLDAGQVAELARGWFSHNTAADATTGFVWRVVLEEGPCRELVHEPAYRAIVNAWLLKHGQQKAWWHIWREMHTAEPSDLKTVRAAVEADLAQERSYGVANAVRRTVTDRPELAHSLWELLSECEHGQTWQSMWLDLAEVASGPVCWELGLPELTVLAPDLFSAWWRRLWNAFTDESERAVLRSRAREWLGAHADHPSSDKVRGKLLEEDAAERITPATVFGQSPPTVTSATRPPGAAAGPAALRGSDLVERPVAPTPIGLACPQCRRPIRIPIHPSRPVQRWVCLCCAASLVADTEAGTVKLLGVYRRQRALPLGATKSNPKRARAIVHCDVCGGDFRAFIGSAEVQLAIDDECGLLHEVPIELLRSWLADRRKVALRRPRHRPRRRPARLVPGQSSARQTSNSTPTPT
jgi:hypothetical protein